MRASHSQLFILAMLAVLKLAGIATCWVRTVLGRCIVVETIPSFIYVACVSRLVGGSAQDICLSIQVEWLSHIYAKRT